MTGYRFTKKEFYLFSAICGPCPLSQRQFEGVTVQEQNSVLDALERKRFLTRMEGVVVVDRVLCFLLRQMGQAAQILESADGAAVIYACSQVAVLLREEPHNRRMLTLSAWPSMTELEREALNGPVSTFRRLGETDAAVPQR